MKEKHVKTLLFSYLDGELNERERHLVQAHLDRCPACRKELDYTRRVRALLTPKEEVELNPYFWTRLSARLEQEGRQVRRWAGLEWAFRRLTPALIGVTVVLLMVLSVRWYWNGDLDAADYLDQIWSFQEEEALLVASSAPSRDDVLALLIAASEEGLER